MEIVEFYQFFMALFCNIIFLGNYIEVDQNNQKNAAITDCILFICAN